ncbi:hypothetical protein [Streptomyces buecherae]|uniref:hypothetical protein n=1 Tax=Streptomyces buecherae TaxID=2763006 RepID=UPI0036BCBF57
MFGHTAFLGEAQAAIFRLATHTLLADLHRRIAGGGPGARTRSGDGPGPLAPAPPSVPGTAPTSHDGADDL